MGMGAGVGFRSRGLLTKIRRGGGQMGGWGRGQKSEFWPGVPAPKFHVRKFMTEINQNLMNGHGHQSCKKIKEIRKVLRKLSRDCGRWRCKYKNIKSGAPNTTGDPLHSRAACTQPCYVNTHSRAHCSPGARLCEQWGHGCVNNIIGGTAVCKCPAV